MTRQLVKSDTLKPRKQWLFLILVLLAVLISPSALALETNCKDGLDNDIDGKLDSLDADCIGRSCSTTAGKIWIWSYLVGENLLG